RAGEGTVRVVVGEKLAHEVARRSKEKSDSGVKVRLYSEYPFPWRKDGGPHDDFEKEALRRLGEHPEQPVREFTQYEGRPVLRYTSAWVLKESCLRCHNDKYDTPPRAWKLGEGRGALEIIRPLDKDVARAQAGLGRSFVLVAAVAAGLLGLSVLVLVVGNRRRARG